MTARAESKSYNGSLEGLNVIDFGHYYAGPMTGMLLADQGANVIRIVKSGDRELPDQQYRLLNRNKNLLELDLKSENGKTQALSLLEKADVVIENFRPGVMQRLGLDYASVKPINPGLIYLSLPGFASTDKERAHLQAWEGILGAASGIYTDMGWARFMLDYPPVYTGIPVCSAYGAAHGVTAVLSALLARETHGVGTVLEVPLVRAGLSTFSLQFIYEKSGCGVTKFAVDHPNAKRLENAEMSDELKADRYSSADTPEEQEKKLFHATGTYLSLPFTKMFRCSDVPMF